MKRTLAAMLMLLLLVPAQPPAQAAQTQELWDADRVIRANLTVPAAVDLAIGPGVNISFEPDLNASPFSPVQLNVNGGLEVCGTADRPAVFYASNESLFIQDSLGGYINIEGNGDPRQLKVRNCNFQNFAMILNGTAGLFRDCSFDTTFIYIIDSAVEFLNCSFVRSVVSILNPATLNQTRLSGCVFDSSTEDRWDPFWGYYDQLSAIKVSGYARIDNCIISGYGTGIESSSGVPIINGCLVKDCQTGIWLVTTDPADTPRVEGCIVQNCTTYALIASGNLHLLNCTINDSNYGLVLYDYDNPSVPSWTLSGNRIFGNRQYGVSLYGEEVNLGDTRFDDGAGRTNQQGRVKKSGALQVAISTRGTISLSDIYVNLTDAFGNLTAIHPAGSNIFIASDLTEYIIENSGQRRGYSPYTVRASWSGVFCETVVLAGTRNVTLVLEVLPDLVPLEITLDPPFPRAGDWVAISCTVKNTGPMPSSRVAALFTLDGERLDQSELFPVSPRSFSYVRALDWKAHRGAHTVTVRLDPQNVLEENDESNNNLTFNFTVRDAPLHPADTSYIAYAGGATILMLACAGSYLFLRRRKRATGE